MASLDSLPADQRAVLQLVLQRGRSYDDIAAMLAIDRAAVRQRALDGFDSLGPGNSIPDLQRALLTDYLLGQLPPRVAEQVRERLAGSPPERAWARVIASEVGPLAASPLPEIPVGPSRRDDRPPSREDVGEPVAEPAPAAAAQPEPAAADVGREARATARDRRSAGPTSRSAGPASRSAESAAPARPPRPPSSRRGGAILLGALAAAVAAIVIILIVTGGSGSKHGRRTASTPRTTQTGTASTSTTSTTKARLITQVNLVSPTGAKRTAGIGQVISEGSTLGVVIVAQGVPPNTKSNAYAVWLYNSPSDSKLVGFVNQRVGSNGRLETEGALPANASHYKQMLVTIETHAKPKSPGTIVLEGSLKLS